MKCREKNSLQKNAQNISEVGNNFKGPNICVTGIPEKERGPVDRKKYLKKCGQNFPNLMTTVNSQNPRNAITPTHKKHKGNNSKVYHNQIY